jgi:hypothetical protein
VEQHLCTTCGYDLRKKDIKGIGGWLLWLCIMLTIIDPLIMLWNGYLITEMRYDLRDIPVVFFLQLFALLLLIINIILSMLAGGRLWLKMKRVITYCKKVLIASLCIQFIIIILVIIMGYLIGAPITIRDIVNDIGAIVIGFGIWYWYLTESVRVKNTFYSEFAKKAN